MTSCLLALLLGAAPAYPHAAVAADHPAASAAGVEVLRAGGNVVDAAVATSFALSVVRPESCGLGGGGFMVIWDAAKQSAVCLDYRERAPAAATREMFLDDPDASRVGGKAVAVPGTVAGLCRANAQYGRLPLKTVLGPALRLAADGVPLDRYGRAARAGLIARFREKPELRDRFAAIWEQYLFAGKLPVDGVPVKSPQWTVLTRIAHAGPDAFYTGPVADSLVKAVRDAGGVLTAEDFADVPVVEREPVVGTFGGVRLYSMPPPSSGGVALLETLNVLTAYETRVGEPFRRRGVPFAHALTEAMKHAFADRAEFLGDPEAAAAAGKSLPVTRLLSEGYARTLAGRIEADRTFPPPHYGRTLPPRDGGTSHLSVIDAAGNAVACTETVNLAFGSLVVDPEFGVVLNDEMDDFAAVPGEPNAFGLIQSEANAVGPGRVPLSSMTPTIGVEDGRAVLAVGASGGPRIITATLHAVLNRVRFGTTAADAVAAPRWHHQWLPDELQLEPAAFGPLRAGLERIGHTVAERGELGACQIVVRESDGTLSAASDPRKGGEPAGY